jgi:uncharacterized membrane protein YbhN (UPF0104 family)
MPLILYYCANYPALLKRSAKKLFSYLIKAAVLVLAFVFIYHRYIEKGRDLKDFQDQLHRIGNRNVTLILTAVGLLMLVNWLLESFKWRYLTRYLVKITAWQSIEAVFCGLTWAIFTPNRLGEYAGRVLFLPNRKRVYGVFAMAVGSFGQNVITNVVGLSAGIWFVTNYYHLPLWLYASTCFWSAVFIVFILIFYFHIKWLVNLLDKIPYIKKYHRFFGIMGRYTKRELITIMLYCLARFAVFSFQYYLIIHLLVPEISVFQMMMMVFVMFFIQSALPSLDLVDVAVRNGTAAFLFGFITHQTIAIMAAVSVIWLINLIIPAILGSVFVFKLNFFDRNV